MIEKLIELLVASGREAWALIREGNSGSILMLVLIVVLALDVNALRLVLAAFLMLLIVCVIQRGA